MKNVLAVLCLFLCSCVNAGINPPSKFFICKSNSHCILDYNLCGFRTAINKSYQEKYKSWKEKTLLEIQLKCMNPHSDKSSYKPQCVDSKCKAVAKEK